MIHNEVGFHKEKLDLETKLHSIYQKQKKSYKHRIIPRNPFQKMMEFQENPRNLS